MLAPRPPDYPSLFPLGFHPLQMDQIDQICVTNFPLSTSRKPIMDGLRVFVQRLLGVGIRGDLWLDGSFFTEKIDPKDVDVVLRIDAVIYNTGSIEIRAAIDWVIANQKSTLKCDSYALFEYPADHPLHDEGKWWYSYWHAKWGFSREEDPKGIVVLSLSGAGP
jgi:hypothetical protein